MKAQDAYQLLEVATRALIEKCENLRGERDEARKLYNDLLMSVERKFPDETRHQTARRYIQQSENGRSGNCGTEAVPYND